MTFLIVVLLLTCLLNAVIGIGIYFQLVKITQVGFHLPKYWKEDRYI
jgi:accessory gene regulator protein AgrB